jgi:hypothetical protein
MDEIPLIDDIDRAILMHRDAHFAGNFFIMIDYYKKEGKGVQPEFSIERIEQLALFQEYSAKDLNALILSDLELEEVIKAQEVYALLKKSYESNAPIAEKIADLILSEELDTEKEVQALIALGKQAVAPLLKIVETEQFYNPLFPGYGKAPELALKIIGEIKDPAALRSLFNAIGEVEFDEEEEAIRALVKLGEPAKEFLLKQLKAQPITKDNERAATALTHFAEEKDVTHAALELLDKEAFHSHPQLAVELIYIAMEEGSRTAKLQLKALLDKSTLAKNAREALTFSSLLNRI